MKVYNTQEEVEADIVDRVLKVNDDVTFNCSISIEADIKAWNIDARDIKAWNIDARDIKAWNIDARDIKAWDINAEDIKAGDISYYAVCFAYGSIVCTNIKGRRENARHFALDGEVTIVPKKHVITIDGKDIELSAESYEAFKKQFTD